MGVSLHHQVTASLGCGRITDHQQSQIIYTRSQVAPNQLSFIMMEAISSGMQRIVDAQTNSLIVWMAPTALPEVVFQYLLDAYLHIEIEWMSQATAPPPSARHCLYHITS